MRDDDARLVPLPQNMKGPVLGPQVERQPQRGNAQETRIGRKMPDGMRLRVRIGNTTRGRNSPANRSYPRFIR